MTAFASGASFFQWPVVRVRPSLNSKFLQDRAYKTYFARGSDTFTGQDMGLLTRIDPENEAIHYDNRKGTSGTVSKSVSKNYIATFQINDEKIALIGLHFLAQPDSAQRKDYRQAQADAAVHAMALEEQGQGYRVVVMGDFNDYDGDDCCKDHIGSMPITNVLSHIKEMDSARADDDLVSAAQFIPQANRYTAFEDALFLWRQRFAIFLVQDRIQRNFVEAAIIKATKSFNELKGSVEKNGNQNEQVEKINTIISNLN